MGSWKAMKCVETRMDVVDGSKYRTSINKLSPDVVRLNSINGYAHVVRVKRPTVGAQDGLLSRIKCVVQGCSRPKLLSMAGSEVYFIFPRPFSASASLGVQNGLRNFSTYDRESVFKASRKSHMDLVLSAPYLLVASQKTREK